MARLKLAVLAGSAALAGIGVSAATRPGALVAAEPGLWEISGVPGAKAPVRECLASMDVLLQFEHRRASCTHRLVSETGSTVIVDYQCPRGGFGRSKVTALTPRSLRIETQGIADNLPFGYVLQARRAGGCPERG